MQNLNEVTQEYKIDLLAVQEVRWRGRSIIGKDCRIQCSCDDDDENIFEADFIVSKHNRSRIIIFKPIDMRLWVLGIRGEFKNYSFICAHVLTKEKSKGQDWLEETEEDVQAVPLIYEGTSKSFRTLFFKKSLFMLQT